MRYWGRISIAVVVGSLTRLAQRLVTILGVGVAVPALGLILAMIPAMVWIPIAEHRLDNAWSEALASLTTLPERQPPRGASPSALSIEVVAARLGIDLATLGQADRTHPDAATASSFADLQQPLTTLTQALIDTPAARPAIPAPLNSFLTKHSADIGELGDLLDREAPPRWEVDLELGKEAPRPNLEAQRYLHQVLIAEAVRRNQAGDAAGADLMLTGSWQLNQPTLARPERKCFLAALSHLTLELGCLRALDLPTEAWIARLSELDLETAYRETLLTEAWQAIQESRGGRVVTRDLGWLAVVTRPILRPFERITMHDHAQAMRQAVIDLPLQDLTTFHRSRFEADLRRSIPRWNVVANLAMVPVARDWLVTVRTALDVELTTILLNATSLETNRDWRALAEFRGEKPSTALGLKWVFDVNLERLSIRLDGDPLPVPPGDVLLPTLEAELVFTEPLDVMKERALANDV